MKKKSLVNYMLVLSLFSFVNINAQPREFTQNINIENIVQAGKLMMFPGTANDSNNYYYLPNKIRVAQNDRGEPQFLFLYYVTNAGSGDADQAVSIGKTGGYVHLVIGLHTLPEEMEEAKIELKKKNPRGIIKGPVMYKSGTMSLVTKSVITNSSNPDPNQKRVLGIGPAPVLEGDNVAVSFVLDSLDAKIMWESLQTPNPDLSFNMNMNVAGYIKLSFSIEMNWDKVYQHKIFNAGLATPILKSEIGIASQEMKEKGAIKITQVGEDANLQRLQDVITSKLLDMCFVPFGGEGSPNWAELAKPLNDGKSYLDRASDELSKETDRVEKRNKEIQDFNSKERSYADEENRKRRAENDVRRKARQEELEKKEKEAAIAKQKAASETNADRKAQADADAQQLAKEVDNAKMKVAAENNLAQKELDAQAARTKANNEKDPAKKNQYEKEALAKEQLALAAHKEVEQAGADIAAIEIEPTRVKPTTGDADALGEVFRDPKNYKDADKPIGDVEMLKTNEKKEQELPKVAIVASYQQKKIRHSGVYTAEAKSFLPTTWNEPIGGNIGRINCRDCIQKINTYDPLYVQRELVAFLDGQLAGEFDKYINYVTVMMRKKHAGGDITTQEVRVDRRNFNKEGNRFKLLYGWMKGDDDRRNWLNYEYKTTWNFFGGATLTDDWKVYDQPVIPLASPVTKNTVVFDGDADKLIAENVRSVTARIYYKIAGMENMKQITMNTSKGFTSASLDYLLPRNEAEYEYELEYTKGTTNVKTGRIKSSQGTIYIDQGL